MGKLSRTQKMGVFARPCYGYSAQTTEYGTTNFRVWGWTPTGGIEEISTARTRDDAWALGREWRESIK